MLFGKEVLSKVLMLLCNIVGKGALPQEVVLNKFSFCPLNIFLHCKIKSNLSSKETKKSVCVLLCKSYGKMSTVPGNGRSIEQMFLIPQYFYNIGLNIKMIYYYC